MTIVDLTPAPARPGALKPVLYRDTAAGLQTKEVLVAPAPMPTPAPFLELRRATHDVGRTGVHPVAIKTMVGCYAALFAVFWAIFGGPATALTLGVITVLGVMFFGLLAGGILVSDSPPAGERTRSFAEFLRGPVRIANTVIDGREAFAQIVALPACLVVGALVIGLIWRAAAGS